MRYSRRVMVMMVTACALATAFVPPCGAADGGTAGEPPEWAQRLRLVLNGGPVASDVEVAINGQFVVAVQGEPEWFHEIADLVRPGVNELSVSLKRPDAPRAGAEDLGISIREVSESGRKVVTRGTPLAELAVPAATQPEPTCAATVRFWAGPPPGPPPEGLKNAYWVYFTGPAAHVSVGVVVNEHLVYESSSGQEWFDITPFVRKGKNSASFELRPTCLVPDTGRPGSLVVGVGPARVRGQTVEFTEPPQAEVEIDPKRDTVDKVIKRSFRAW